MISISYLTLPSFLTKRCWFLSWMTWTSLYRTPLSQKRGARLWRLVSLWWRCGTVWLLTLRLALMLLVLNSRADNEISRQFSNYKIPNSKSMSFN